MRVCVCLCVYTYLKLLQSKQHRSGCLILSKQEAAYVPTTWHSKYYQPRYPLLPRKLYFISGTKIYSGDRTPDPN